MRIEHRPSIFPGPGAKAIEALTQRENGLITTMARMNGIKRRRQSASRR